MLPGHNKAIQRILITSDYKYIISSDSNEDIRIWDLKDRSHIGLFDASSARGWILMYREIGSFFN